MMRIAKYAAPAALAVAATALASGTAAAAPANTAPAAAATAPSAVHGTSHGIEVTFRLNPERTGVVETIDAGAFALNRDATHIGLTDSHGAIIGTIPTAVTVSGHRVSLAPQIGHAGRTLTLTPIDALQTDWQHPTLAESVGAFGGALLGWTIFGPVGLVIGALCGLPFFGVGALPGALIGTVIGIAAGVSIIGTMGFDYGATFPR